MILVLCLRNPYKYMYTTWLSPTAVFLKPGSSMTKPFATRSR